MLPFIHLKINIKALDRITLPLNPGSAIRGFFGFMFKKIVCSDYRKECSRCLLTHNCAYSYIFETPVPDKSEVMRKYEHVPKPFVLFPPLTQGGIINQNSETFFKLTIIGKAIDYLPYFVYTLINLGDHGIGRRRSKFEVKNIIHLNSIENDSVIYENGAEKINFDNSKIDNTMLDRYMEKLRGNSELVYYFLSPLRIIFDGSHLQPEAFEFHNIIRVLLRRIFLLSKFHTPRPLEIEFNELIEKSQAIKKLHSDLFWYNLRRHSSRQQRVINMGGIMGNAVFQGDFSPFLPYLVLGTYINMGKNTTFGLGKFDIDSY